MADYQIAQFMTMTTGRRLRAGDKSGPQAAQLAWITPALRGIIMASA
jgi:hypothetical protein